MRAGINKGQAVFDFIQYPPVIDILRWLRAHQAIVVASFRDQKGIVRGVPPKEGTKLTRGMIKAENVAVPEVIILRRHRDEPAFKGFGSKTCNGRIRNSENGSPIAFHRPLDVFRCFKERKIRCVTLGAAFNRPKPDDRTGHLGTKATAQQLLLGGAAAAAAAVAAEVVEVAAVVAVVADSEVSVVATAMAMAMAMAMVATAAISAIAGADTFARTIERSVGPIRNQNEKGASIIRRTFFVNCPRASYIDAPLQRGGSLVARESVELVSGDDKCQARAEPVFVNLSRSLPSAREKTTSEITSARCRSLRPAL